MGGISERGKELKRRRHRRQKLRKLKSRLEKASAADKAIVAEKVRALSPGADRVLRAWGLEDV
jgi:hypothetical protein